MGTFRENVAAPRPRHASCFLTLFAGLAWPSPCAGGAQDVGNFRENVAAGKLPRASDVTFEGLCKDYFFDASSRSGPNVFRVFLMLRRSQKAGAQCAVQLPACSPYPLPANVPACSLRPAATPLL